ncbi:hypothetical protein GCM10025778_33480 [Paeniglutamicibacter antarcticus]|uniref:Uncharacterized protein n=1 Tax=Paeniglutamicibacter antarcticus TaxID=494023 RepID=A0ABP9TPZ6_9MICC
MPGTNLPAVARIVREYCEELQVPSTVARLAQAYAPVISHIDKVGLSARDPFECPMADEYRPHSKRGSTAARWHRAGKICKATNICPADCSRPPRNRLKRQDGDSTAGRVVFSRLGG